MSNNQNTKPNQTSNSVSYGVYIDGVSSPRMIKQESPKPTNNKIIQDGVSSPRMIKQESPKPISNPNDSGSKK